MKIHQTLHLFMHSRINILIFQDKYLEVLDFINNDGRGFPKS